MPKVTQKGQVTIPQKIRTLLSIKTGDDILFNVIEGNVVINKKPASVKNILNYVGFLSHLEGRHSDDILDEMREKPDDPRS